MKRRRWAAGVAAVALVSVLLLIGSAAAAYASVFGIRYEPGPGVYETDDFQGLAADHYEMPSDRGQLLSAYLYFKTDTPKALVVMCHGIGGGSHRYYLPLVDYLCGRGYAVLGYDGTGNGGSEGESVAGLPQGLVDLDYVLDFVAAEPGLRDLPVALFGHSWGGYCVSAVPALHPEVRAVAAVAGFSSVPDIIGYAGRRMLGPLADLMIPLIGTYEFLRFGEYAGMTGLDGFAAMDAGVLVVHGTEDAVVPMAYGYGMYMDAYGDDPRFRFMQLDGLGHDCYLDGEVLSGIGDFYDDWVG